MMQTTAEFQTEVIFNLPPQLDLRAAKALKESLTPLLGKAPRLVLDASAVSKMSTACAQVLLAFGEAAKSASIAVRLRAPSETFATSVALLGMDGIFRES